MDKNELIARIAELNKEKRSLSDAYLDKNQKVEDIDAKLDAVNKELEQRKKELAEIDAPLPGKESTTLFNKEELRRLAKGELRSITIGANGGAVGVGKIFAAVAEKDDLVSQADMNFSPNALTKIPVLLPLGDLTSSTEGTTAVTVDTDAGVSITSLEPKSYARVLPVTAEALTLGVVDLESRMESIFDKAYRKAMHKGMLVGAGTDGDSMLGVFPMVESDIDSSAATSAADYPSRVIGIGTSAAITVSKLAELAIKVQGLDEEYTIIMSPSVYAEIVADTAAGEDVKIYKESIIRDKSIENVKIVVDSYAPVKSSTARKAQVVATPLARYEIGVAKEMTIDTIKVKGDKNTYFQAIAFMDGRQADNRDLYAIARNPS